MTFYRAVIEKWHWWKLLITLSVLLDLHLARADDCWRKAECTCMNRSRLLCSGSTSISLSQLQDIIPLVYLLYLDTRGRFFSSNFIPQLAESCPWLQTIRVEGCRCDYITPYLGKFHFVIIHDCDVPGLPTYSPASPAYTTPSPPAPEVTTPKPASQTTEITTPVPEYPTPAPVKPIPTGKSGDVVISVGSPGFYAVVTVPSAVVASLISAIIACIYRRMTGRSIPCFGRRRNITSGDCEGAGGDEDGERGGDRAEEAPTTVSNPTQNSTSLDGGNSPDNAQTSVKSVAASLLSQPTSDSSVTLVKEVNLIGMRALSGTDQAAKVSDQPQGVVTGSSSTQATLPSHLIKAKVVTSTPCPKKPPKPFSFMTCFKSNDDNKYRPLSPCSTGSPTTPMYHTPAAIVQPSTGIVGSAEPLILTEKDVPALSLRSNKDPAKRLFKGVEPATRRKRKAIQQDIELSASLSDLHGIEKTSNVTSV